MATSKLVGGKCYPAMTVKNYCVLCGESITVIGGLYLTQLTTKGGTVSNCQSLFCYTTLLLVCGWCANSVGGVPIVWVVC